MSPKGKAKADAQGAPINVDEPQSKKQKAEDKKREAEMVATKAKEAADKKMAQSNLITQCCKPNATDAQKGFLAEYKALPHRDERKTALLAKFLADKKCTFWQELARETIDAKATSTKGLQGYGTRTLVTNV